ncbi:MAG: YceD family protein [Ardenticatenaceae bacterium]
MQFNVAQLLKEPIGSTRKYLVNDDLDDLDPELVIQTPIKGQLKFTKIPKGILVNGDFKTMLEFSCDRCLEPLDQTISIELEEEFRPAVDLLTGASLPQSEDDEEATQIDAKNIIDLSEVIRQALLLGFPSRRLCRSDCKGLCVECGQNLNQGECNCATESLDPRWSALRSLLEQNDA